MIERRNAAKMDKPLFANNLVNSKSRFGQNGNEKMDKSIPIRASNVVEAKKCKSILVSFW